MAVVNERAVVSAFNMLERTAIQLPKILGGLTFDQQIQKLFANGEQGFFYDPNDLTTMYQNSTGTIPVTDVGQPVGLIYDKSGRNNHAYQTASASRPILRKNAVTGANYLEFDDVDDTLQTGVINFAVTDKISVFAGQQTYLPSATGTLIETGTRYTNPNGGFAIYAPATASTETSLPSLSFAASGGGGEIPASILRPTSLKSTVTLAIDLSKALTDEQVQFRANGIRLHSAASSTIVAGSSFANAPVGIGGRIGTTALNFNGRIYGLICVGRLTTDDETIALEKELAKRMGVTLSV